MTTSTGAEPRAYDPAADPVHGSGWNSAARWGGWNWREPRDGEWFRTCSFCGCIHPEDLAPELVPQGACAVCGETGWEAHFRAQQPAWYPQAKARGELDGFPADQIARAEAMHAPHAYDPGGAYASWADRKYGFPHKFYVENLKNREPDRLFIVGTHSEAAEGPYAPGGAQHEPIHERYPGQRWVRPSEIPEGAVTAGHGELREDRDMVQIDTRRTLFAKFYTVHLSDPAIDAGARDAIERAGGLRFTFTDDGRIGWDAYSR